MANFTLFFKMLTKKKQITVLGLLLLVALPLLFSAGILLKQQLLQHQRMQRFKTELLETVTVNAGNIVWVKAGKEIKIDGKLFDVKSFKVIGANIIFTGFFDHKEDQLVQQISKLGKQKNQSQNPLGQQAIKFLFISVYFCYNEFTIDGGNWQLVSQQYQPFFEIIPEAHLHPPIHPPC